MTPVMQDKFGNGKGNCFQACVASLFDLPLEEVPDFMAEYYPRKKGADLTWLEGFREWLRPRGLGAIIAQLDRGIPSDWHGTHLVAVRTERGVPHQVIWCDGKIVHDPYPGGSVITGWINAIIIFPLDVRGAVEDRKRRDGR